MSTRPLHHALQIQSLGLGCLLLITSALAGPPASKRFEFRRALMGTEFRLVLYASSPDRAQSAGQAAFSRVARLEELLSDYRPDSQISQLTQTAYSAPQIVDPELFSLLVESKQIWRASGGAFDITIRPLLSLWRRAARSGRLPTTEEMQHALARTGFSKVLLNRQTGSVRFQQSGLRLDLGAIAKGRAADRAFETLKEHGIERSLVDAGGDIRVGAPPPGESGWKIRLHGLGGHPLTYSLQHTAIATSGEGFRSVQVAGKQYSHIIDPRTGKALEGRRLVTVLASEAGRADAWATALSVMSRVEGLRLIESIPDLEVRIESGSSGVQRSSGFPP